MHTVCQIYELFFIVFITIYILICYVLLVFESIFFRNISNQTKCKNNRQITFGIYSDYVSMLFQMSTL